MNVFDMREKRATVATKMESIQLAAAKGARAFTQSEEAELCNLRYELTGLDESIKSRQSQNTLSRVNPLALLGGGQQTPNRDQRVMSHDYSEAFLAFLRSGGKQAPSALSEGFDNLFGGFAVPSLPSLSAASYEGGNSSGGFAVSVPTDQNIAPLGLPDVGVRSLARVIATATDLKLPIQSAISTAAIKAESGGASNSFTTSSPTLAQTTLSAFMMGVSDDISWELLTDVPTFQAFAVNDLIRAVQILEDGYFVTGSGSGQPQGLIGNVGTGTGSATAYESTGAYLIDATFDVLGTLKAVYYPNAAWLMSRATGATIRKAQAQSNLFAPIWTRENGRDYLHGYPVAFSSSMPAIPSSTNAGTTVALFGSFQDGVVIGDRGGAGVFVKILDQPKATQGLTTLLCYRRTDQRIRLSEAIQGVSISHS